MKKLSKPTALADLVHLLAPNSGASDEYCRGAIVGAVSGLMASGFEFETSWTLVRARVSAENRERLSRLRPESWPMA